MECTVCPSLPSFVPPFPASHLSDNLASGHDEIAFVTADGLRNLVLKCVTDSTVERSLAILKARQAGQGAEQVAAAEGAAAGSVIGGRGGEGGDGGGKEAGGEGEGVGVRAKLLSPMERVCAAVQRSLGLPFSAAWDLSLLLVATLVDRIGECGGVWWCSMYSWSG